MDDWKDEKRKCFYFYGEKFNIMFRDDEYGQFIVCTKGSDVCIAYQFNTIWFIAYGPTGANKKLKSAMDAWKKISRNIFDALDEAGV